MIKPLKDIIGTELIVADKINKLIDAVILLDKRIKELEIKGEVNGKENSRNDTHQNLRGVV